jgi:regulator of sirC expression with transglutaminase-like and TPR domain
MRRAFHTKHLLAGAFLAFCTTSAWGQANLPPSPDQREVLQAQVNAQLAEGEKHDPNLVILKKLLAQPEASIDLAQAEVTIEKMVDPKADEKATLKQLDDLAEAIKARFPQGDATDKEIKAGLLLNSLKYPGPWNDNQPFHYDLDDPMGSNPNHKLLSYYLATRKGNCVSMPVLFVVLSQKLGLEATLSNAPTHEFARLRKDDGTWLNVEATSFGTKSDLHYQQELGITDRAIQTGIYLHTLSKKQDILVMVGTLEQYYRHNRSPDEQLGLTTLVLMTDPKDVDGWLWRGDAYARLIEDKFIKKYGSVENIPPSEQENYVILHTNNLRMFERAEALGWVEETEQHKDDYLKMIQQVKAKNQQGG